MTTTLKGCSPTDGWVSLGISQRWGYLDHIGHWSTPLGVSVFLDNSMSLSLPCCSYSKTFPSAHSSHHVHEHETKHLWSRNSETVSTNSHSFIKYLLRSTVIRRGTEIGLFPVCYLVSQAKIRCSCIYGYAEISSFQNLPTDIAIKTLCQLDPVLPHCIPRI